MIHRAKSIRTFIGAKNYNKSRSFYKDIGFEETYQEGKLSYFKVTDELGFYLQDYFIKDWAHNSMIFLEVDSVDRYWKELNENEAIKNYKEASLRPIIDRPWGKECFLIDPSGILWHFGEFYNLS